MYFYAHRLSTHVYVTQVQRPNLPALVANLHVRECPSYSRRQTTVPCNRSLQHNVNEGHLTSKLNFMTVPDLPSLIFPFHLLPSPVHPTGFFFCIFPGFLAIFILSCHRTTTMVTAKCFEFILPKSQIYFTYNHDLVALLLKIATNKSQYLDTNANYSTVTGMVWKYSCRWAYVCVLARTHSTHEVRALYTGCRLEPFVGCYLQVFESFFRRKHRYGSCLWHSIRINIHQTLFRNRWFYHSP